MLRGRGQLNTDCLRADGLEIMKKMDHGLIRFSANSLQIKKGDMGVLERRNIFLLKRKFMRYQRD